MAQQVIPECRTNAYATWVEYLAITQDWTNEKKDSSIGKTAVSKIENLGELLSQWKTSNEDDANSIQLARDSINLVSVLIQQDADLVKAARIAAEAAVSVIINRCVKEDNISLGTILAQMFRKRERELA